ncbi:MAG: glycosyltransferase family 2 protein [Pseudomonadota bacterium]
MIPLAIVITDFNGYARTRRCLAALYAGSQRDFRVIVVDHGTTAETAEGLARDFPQVLRLPASPELWWTGATNAGIRQALTLQATRIMLLNNDCYVTSEAIARLLREADLYPAAIVAPVQRDLQSGRLTAIAPSSCFALGFPSLPGLRELNAAQREAGVIPTRLIVGGRGVVIPAPVLARVGFLDEESLPHYGADHDFYLRARASGVPLLTATAALVDIDNTATSAASDPGRLTFAEFRATLHSIRSHRNLRDVSALFRRHYPVRRLYALGVLLYVGRYCALYLVKRASFLVGRAGRERAG